MIQLLRPPAFALAAAAMLLALHPVGASNPAADAETEEHLIAAHPANLRRVGERLEIRLPGLEPITFVDRSCEELEGHDCVHYRLDAVFTGGEPAPAPSFGVEEKYFEGSSYTLVTSDGMMIETGARPVASPDGRYLASAASSDSHPPDTGILLLERGENGAVRPVRAVPTGALTNYSELRWMGTGCVTLLASVADRWGAYGQQQNFYLVQASPEWTLTTDAAICTASMRDTK